MSFIFKTFQKRLDAFRDCRSLESLTVPQTVTSIGSGAFQGCHSLKEIKLPESVKTIESAAFSDCRSLASIAVPKSVTAVENGAFDRCLSLKDIYYAGSAAQWTDIQIAEKNDAFTTASFHEQTFDIPQPDSTQSDFTCRTLADDTLEIIWYSSNEPELTIPDQIGGKTVTRIAGQAFENKTELTRITIGDSITYIGTGAFEKCTSLKSAVLPKGITEIADWTFNYCRNLKSITIPGKVKTIGYRAFGSCTLLLEVTIPSSVKTIGDVAFYGCKKLSKAVIGKNTSSIGQAAFSGCSSLGTLTIRSDKLKKVGIKAFAGIRPSAKIKVPSKKLSAYRKLLKGKGQSSKVAITVLK